MSNYLTFVGVAAATVAMPGPDMLVVLRTALTGGTRAGVWAAAGSAVGNTVWGAATVLGATALLAASPGVFTAVKLAGAAYLGWLGAQALVAARRGDAVSGMGAEGARMSRVQAFRRGLASDLANVKVGLFWTALVPQFLTAGAGALLPVAMVLTMAGLVFGGLVLFAAVAGRLRAALERPRVSPAVNSGVSALLLGLALKLATVAR